MAFIPVKLLGRPFLKDIYVLGSGTANLWDQTVNDYPLLYASLILLATQKYVKKTWNAGWKNWSKYPF